MKATESKPDVLMLDLGDVLIDLQIEKFHHELMNRLGRDLNLGNEDLHHAYMAGKFDEEMMRAKIEAQYGLVLEKDEFSRFWSLMLGPDRTELVPLLREISKKTKLALCSNTDATHIRFLKERKSRMVEGFDYYCYSFELGYV